MGLWYNQKMKLKKSISPGEEDPRYLSEQIITCIGNKRALLTFIGTAVDMVKKELGKDKLVIADMFSGSGVVSRYFKQHAAVLHVNDMEDYCRTINRCYLTNARQDEENTFFGQGVKRKEQRNGKGWLFKNEEQAATKGGCPDMAELAAAYQRVVSGLKEADLRPGFISEMYAPADDENIKAGERVFYTTRNAMYIDTARQRIEELAEPYRTMLLAPLLCEASVHTNTGGVFKGFYKNTKTGVGQFGGDGRHALQRIMADIHLQMPVFSRFACDTEIHQRDANQLAKELPPLDLAYMDPPYNQHPYGSNYFMLNLINNYERPEEVSRVSGIPTGWNKSQYNKKSTAFGAMKALCQDLPAKYLLISFNDEGFIAAPEMVELLESLGEVKVFDKEYNTFRGCRNLGNRSIYVKELLYLVKKG